MHSGNPLRLNNPVQRLQLERIKAERGGRVEDGAVAPDKPLVEVLREAKEAKEAAFQAVWKSMKTGARFLTLFP